MKAAVLSTLLTLTFAAAPAASAAPVRIVAAENFYGDVAKQIGGDAVAVTSILANPDDDPHLFEASVQTAKAVADAQVAIENGVGYDTWMEKLLKAHKAPNRREIDVGALAGRRPGDNPHLWYDPANMKAVGKALGAALAALVPAHRSDYLQGEARFAESLKPLEAKIGDMRTKFMGTPVAASEPVFGYMAALLGLDVHGEKFALAVMNGAEPAASDVAAFEDALTGHKVKAMLFNAQASEPTVQRLVKIAKASGVPVVGVSETEPPGTAYQAWMLAQLDALDAALSAAP